MSLEFDGIAANATVYINGKELGFHPYAYTSFRYDLTSDLILGRRNVISVKVDNSQQPSSRWYVGAGIYRHARLVLTEPLHIAPWGVFISTPTVSSTGAAVSIETELVNDTAKPVDISVSTTIYGPSGASVAISDATLQIPPKAHDRAQQSGVIQTPVEWTPKTPALYRAVTKVRHGRVVIDSVETTFGVRTLAWSAKGGLLLNGQSIKLTGGSVHHDDGPLGAAAYDRAEVRKVELLKAAGFNAVRTAHNTPSQAFLDACDRLGLMVLDESFDVWQKSKVKFDYSRYFDAWWERDLDAMVKRDRNHPSVIFWGIGNEIPEAWTQSGEPIAKMLAERVHSLDPTRPVTQAFPGATYTPAADAVMSQVDIAGYNYNLALNGAKDHARVPSRIMMSTESLPPAAFSEWQQAHDHTYMIGEFVWAAMDYLGESGAGTWSFGTPKVAKQMDGFEKGLIPMLANIGANGKSVYDSKRYTDDPPTSPLFPGWPWHGAYTGDLDITGNRKPQSYYRDILWHGGDRVYAAVRVPAPDGMEVIAIGWTVIPTVSSWTWPGRENKNMQVEVYAGTDSVRLYLNDKLLGEMPTSTGEEHKAIFNVPYAPGTLKAVGVDGNKEVATYELHTAEAPAKLQLLPDRVELEADGEDLSFVTVQAEDAKARWQPNADHEVTFSLSGPGTIVAVGNADLKSMESYQAHQRSLFQGRALVVIRTTKAAGTLRLTASAPGLAPSTVALHSHAGRPIPEIR